MKFFSTKIFLFTASIFLGQLCFANDIDSLEHELQKAKHDSDRVMLLTKIAHQCQFSDVEKSESYSFKALSIHNDTVSETGKQKYFKILSDIGISKAIKGEFEESIKYFFRVLKGYEEIKNQDGIASAYNSIGNVYKAMKKFETALRYYSNAYEIFKILGDDNSESMALNNIATIYAIKNENRKALKYYKQAEYIKIRMNDFNGLIYSYNNYSAIYERMNVLDSALFFCKKVEKIIDSIPEKNYDNLLSNLSVQGRIYTKLGRFKDAEVVLEKNVKLASEKGFQERLMYAYLDLKELYNKQSNFKEALKYTELYYSIKDSLYNLQYEKEVADINIKYDTDKKQQQILIQEEQLKKEKVIRYGIGLGSVLLIIMLTLIYMRYKVKSKLSNELQNKNRIIEQKNQDILSSISYAKRIQSAILPPDKLVKKYLPESFILYKPKDIVAGDFYWLEAVQSARHSALDAESPNRIEIAGQASHDDIILFAAADCTGHGVPGAMVSVVCNNGLNRSVREYGLTDPGKILDKTREIVVQEFEKSEEEVKDGMDIALCSLQGNTLQYAGAHNPLWIIREGELIEIKADKQPIGQFENPEPYTTHMIELQKGDSIYVFSDGYADQFGGEQGKKMKTANFKKLLLSIQEETMEKQKQLINDAFESWKGSLEQLAGVCVIGLKV